MYLLIIADTVAEAAVVGVNDELTGQAVNAFVSLKDGHEGNDQTKKDLILQVRKSIGPFAAPKAIHVVPDLPKTRSGKIMRRILRKILAGEEDQLGDTSTVRLVLSFLWVLRVVLTRPSCRIRRSLTRSSRRCTQHRRSRVFSRLVELYSRAVQYHTIQFTVLQSMHRPQSQCPVVWKSMTRIPEM